MIKEKYYDKIIAKDYVVVNVNLKVAQFLESDKQRQKEQRKQDKENLSLDQLLKKGFQPASNTSLEQEIIISHKEEKYLRSPEYKEFRNTLKQEIRKVFDIMSEKEKKSYVFTIF